MGSCAFARGSRPMSGGTYMSDLHVDVTTAPSTPNEPNGPNGPSKPAWPFAVGALGLMLVLVVFQMAC